MLKMRRMSFLAPIGRVKSWKESHIMDYCLLFLFSLVLLRATFAPGIIRYVDMEWLLDMRQQFHNVYYLWSSANMLGGGYQQPYRISTLIPLFFVLQLVPNLNDLALKILLLLIVANAGWSAYFMVRMLRTRRRLVAFLSGVLYMVSPVMAIRLPIFIYISLAYSLFPFAITFFIRMLEEKGKTNLLWASLTTTAVLCSSFDIGLILIMMEGAYLIYSVMISLLPPRHKDFASTSKSLATSLSSFGLLLLGLNFFWAWAPLKTLLSAQPISYYIPGLGDYLYWSRSPILLSLGLHTAWDYLGFLSSGTTNNWIWIGFTLLPALVLISALFELRGRHDLFFALMSILFLLLASGPTAPFPIGGINIWLFQHVPLSYLYRDASKFLVPVTVCYVYLLAGLCSKTCQVLSTRPRLARDFSCSDWMKSRRILPHSRSMFALGFLAILVTGWLIGSWSALANFNNHTVPVVVPEELMSHIEWLDSRQDDFRVWWLPVRRYAQYAWYPSETSSEVVDLVRTLSKKPCMQWDFSWLPVGMDFSQLLLESAYTIPSENVGKILGLAGVKFIVFRRDIINPPEPYIVEKMAVSSSLKTVSDERLILEGFINKQKGLVRVSSTPNYDIWMNTYALSSLTVSSELTLIVGGYDSLLTLSDIPDFSFENTTLVFAEQNTPENILKTLSRSSKIIFSNRRDLLDLVLASVDEKFHVPLSRFSGFSDEGWSLGTNPLVGPRSEYPTDFSVNPVVLSNVPRSRIFGTLGIEEGGEYKIFLRGASCPKAGRVRFSVDDNWQSTVELYSPVDLGYEWKYICSIPIEEGAHEVSVTNLDGLNVLDRILAIRGYDLEFYRRKVLSAIPSSAKIIYLFEGEKSFSVDSTYDSLHNSTLFSAGMALSSTGYLNKSTKFTIIHGGSYDLVLKVGFGSGSGHILVGIDGETGQSQYVIRNYELKLLNFTDLTLDAGLHSVSVSGSGKFDLDLMAVFPTGKADLGALLNSSSDAKVSYSYDKVKPTDIHIKVNANSSTFLSFHDTFHSEWKASVDGKILDHFIADGFANGFYLDKTGEIEVWLEFQPQTFVDKTIVVSMVTVVIIFAFIFSDRLRIRFLRART